MQKISKFFRKLSIATDFVKENLATSVIKVAYFNRRHIVY